ncbi:GNAT family N-acetyltransferase [Acidimicrobiia bacterium EGI L10123]|uniref:GNAT family N-acetyltransferase n=1 Tax=Salinilacustrithrix flava TaxID=2957203 RepID=UPI003D7C1648|nr:GNAT family N-acetyltransferase [Acidimicrobiia bacterium EGI L10123]
MSPFTPKPTITGETVVLRPLVATDAQDLWDDVNDDEARRLTGTHADFTRDQIDRWCATRIDQDDRLDLAVVDRSDGAWLGEVVIHDWDPDNRSCGFRIALRSAARGRGVGTEATKLVVDHVLSDPEVNRVSLEVFDFNERARHVYRKVGFVEEGTLREALWWGDEPHDAIVMSILRREWRSG